MGLCQMRSASKNMPRHFPLHRSGLLNRVARFCPPPSLLARTGGPVTSESSFASRHFVDPRGASPHLAWTAPWPRKARARFAL